MTDIQIWEAFKAGDRAAFERIFRTHIRILYKYGSRFTHDSALVDDCIQDLFLDLWQKKNALGTTDSIKRYLLAALRHRIFRRQQQISVDKPIDEERYDFTLELNVEDEIVSRELVSENQENLKDAMLKLSKRQREVIYLKYFQHLSYDEIADIMSISYQAARNLVYQALKALKQYLQVFGLIVFSFIANFFN